MMKISVLMLLIIFVGTAGAESQEKGQSIMFKDKNSEYDHLTSIPKADDKYPDDHCTKMSRQIEKLKGKPQRRYTLIQQYKDECER